MLLIFKESWQFDRTYIRWYCKSIYRSCDHLNILWLGRCINYMIICMFVVNSQLEVCVIVLSTKLTNSFFVLWVIHKAFDKYQLSIEIDIELLVAYAHKMNLRSIFRRLKLIVWLILTRPYLLNSTLGVNSHVCWCIDSHQANKLP